MDKKTFWYEALKAGTMIGVVNVAFSLLMRPLDPIEQQAWATLLSIFSWVVIITLLYGVTRRISARSMAMAPEKGFSFGRGVGFVVAVMLFAGVVMGVYSSVMANFFIKDEVLATVDELMVLYQDIMPDNIFDQTYALARKSALNPFYVTFSSVFGNCFIGLLLSLAIASITRREPDIFARTDDKNLPENE